LAEEWAHSEVRMIAPGLILAEITNVLHKRVVRREIDLSTAEKALNLIMDFDFEVHEEPGMPSLALELASRLGRASTYDCYYLALAVIADCPFWTGDRKFHQAVSNTYPQVKWIGDY